MASDGESAGAAKNGRAAGAALVRLASAGERERRVAAEAATADELAKQANLDAELQVTRH